MTTSSSPPWPEAQTSGTPLSGGEICPSGVTMRMRPGRSVTSIRPSGRNASAHGLARPLATVCDLELARRRRKQVFSPRVAVAIRNVAVEQIATVNDAVTRTTGVFHDGPIAMPIIARCGAGSEPMRTRNSGDYAGIGIAMVTLIDSTVRATIRHSDSPPIASEAATALVNRDRSDGRGAARKARSAGRPHHGRNP